jgi:C-terminal processing protease CtpA/Prc
MRHKTDKCHDCFSDPTPITTDPATAPIDWSDKKVVVLSNRRCYSATNDFIVRMKQAPNVTVVGGITGGGGGMPLSQELPNGWMVRFSAVPMFDADMQHTEFGVMPDIETHIEADDSDDSILLTAIEEIIK